MHVYIHIYIYIYTQHLSFSLYLTHTHTHTQTQILTHTHTYRYRRVSPQHAIAFAMVSHARLGASSAFAGILLELVQRVLDEAREWPRGRAAKVRDSHL